jgi:hypothetical protein
VPRVVKTIWFAWLSPFMMFQAVVLVGGKYGPLCSGPLCQVVTVRMGFPAQLYRRGGHLWTEMAATCPMNINEHDCLLSVSELGTCIVVYGAMILWEITVSQCC